MKKNLDEYTKMVKGNAVKYCKTEWQVEQNKEIGFVVDGDKPKSCIDDLRAQCDERGIKYHHKSGEKKLRELLEG